MCYNRGWDCEDIFMGAVLLFIAGLVALGLWAVVGEIRQEMARGDCTYRTTVQAEHDGKTWKALSYGKYENGELCSKTLPVTQEFWNSLKGNN